MKGSAGTVLERARPPYSLVAKSIGALIISILLLILLFCVAYAVWDLLFYLLFVLFLVGFGFQFLAKDRGITLNRDSDPKIFGLVDNVADRMGVSRLDKIILTTDSNIGVAGIFDRRLLLGVATLDSISSGELYAILFHELAHIKGWDNIIGSSLMRTHAALRTIIGIVSRITILGLILGLVLAVFDFIFSLTILLYSRQREFLADYMASLYVGGDNFASALESYSKASEEFGMKANQVIMSSVSKKVALANLYETTKKSNVNLDEQTKKRIDENIKRNRETTSIFSTHPAMNTRLEKVRGIKGILFDIPKGSCSELLNDFVGKEEGLTKLVYENMPPHMRPKAD